MLTKLEQSVLKVLTDGRDRAFTTSEIAKAVESTAKKVDSACRKLRMRGLVEGMPSIFRGEFVWQRLEK